MRDKIIKHIMSNKAINDYLAKVQPEWRDDFKSHIWLIIFEMFEIESKRKKIEKLYNNAELTKYLMGMITNQLKSNTSSFTKIYKARFQPLDFDMRMEESKTDEERPDIIKRIIRELDNIHWADAILYKMYRGIDPITNELKEAMSYSEIQRVIGINYRSVRNSIIKTDKSIKDKIKII